ncbi:hypothetical protein [Spirosoma sp. KNUC1025]|uniref:hypothetical protein n=1 Tax=Spirosoma sp. KNUC1025 TaxID=2894082 RepID=UPI0038675796|nr:hypothetical protein LN737_19800 [Spirosoma sp. KNUC1025]
MMQSTVLATLQKVNDAKRELADELEKPHSSKELSQIRKGVKLLDNLAADLLLADLQNQSDSLREQAGQLQELSDKINQTSADLAKIATTIKDIADKVNAILSAAAILSGAGLI